MASKFGSLFVDLIARTAGFETDMGRAARIAEQRSRQIQRSIDRGFKAAAGSVAAFATGLVGGLLSAQAAIQGFNNAIQNADRLNELSTRLGISTEQLSEWAYAAQQSGTDLESLSGSLQKFAKTVAAAADAGSRQAELFSALGINVKDAAGNLRDVEELLPEVATRFQNLQNDTTRTALAMELFGRSGAELIEFLRNGETGLNRLGEEARDAGAIISGETAAAADEFNDELAKLRATTNAYFTAIAAQLLPALTELVIAFREFSTENDRIGKTAKLVSTAFDGLSKIWDTFSASTRVNTALFNTYNNTLVSVYTTLKGIASLDFSQAGAGIRNLFNGLGAGFNQATGNIPTTPGRARNARGGSNRRETGTNFSSLEQSVNAFLAGSGSGGGGGKGRGGGGLSEAQREAKRLQESYDSLIASMSEQIALFGKTGEAAKIRYDIENGELAKLTPAQKEKLIGLAQEIDAQKQLNALQEAADERVKREVEAYEEARASNKELIADMQFELSLIGMTNEKRQEAINLRYLSADATEEEIQKVRELTEAQRKAAESAELWDGIQRNLADGLYDAITGAESLTDAVRNFFDEVANMLLRQTLEKLSQQITDAFQASASSGGQSSSGGWMQAMGNFFSTAFSARAMGGPVQAGVPYLVGERGPELFVAPSNGSIVPNHKMGGSGLRQTNNFIIQGRIDRRTEDQIASDVGRKSSTALRRNS